MLFTSPVFLFLFLPTLLVSYFLIPNRTAKNLLLLAFSLFFYAWGEIYYTVVLIISIATNYIFGLLLDANKTNKIKPTVLLLGVTVNLLLLGFYKYANFIVENVNSLLEILSISQINTQPVHLPIGISFFTFQAMSYLIDIYRGEGKVQKNPLDLALYIALFPQLIAGPIIRYHDIFLQINQRQESIKLFHSGIKRFIYGLAKKMIIANPLGYIADQAFATPADELTTSLAWLGIICYSFQIYFDFSAYSDMAIGLGRIFGFRFLENFNYPYISSSIQEFWRRWHISLSSWFRDYLYIPLGGNRCSTLRVYANLVIIFFLCGLWHGASWNFVIWGLFHGGFLVIERAGFNKILSKLWRPAAHLYTLLVVMIAWVFFRADDLNTALNFLGAMIGFGAEQTTTGAYYYLDNEISLLLILACIGSTPFWKHIDYRLDDENLDLLENKHQINDVPVITKYSNTKFLADAFVILAIGFICISYVAAQTYNPFIYFRF